MKLFLRAIFFAIFLTGGWWLQAGAEVPSSLQSGTASITTLESPSGKQGGTSSEQTWLTYQVKWMLVKTGRSFGPHGENFTSTCINTGCGQSCTKRHKGSLTGIYSLLLPNIQQAEKDANKAALRSGGTPYPADWTSIVADPLRRVAAWAKAQKGSIVLPHWAAPCTTSTRIYGFTVYDFDIEGTFVQHIRQMENGKTIIVDKNGSSHKATLARIWVPDSSQPIEEMLTKSCNCKSEK